MKLKWESNSRVSSMAAQGQIHPDDIIRRTTPDKFPSEAATVRMHKVREKKPFVTVHIRGPKKTTKGWNGHAFEYSTTCRVNLGGSYSKSMCSNGDLDESLSWLDVHNVVEQVKETMEL